MNPTLFLTMLVIGFILNPAMAYGILGVMCIQTGLQLRRARRLSRAYLSRQLSPSL